MYVCEANLQNWSVCVFSLDTADCALPSSFLVNFVSIHSMLLYSSSSFVKTMLLAGSTVFICLSCANKTNCTVTASHPASWLAILWCCVYEFLLQFLQAYVHSNGEYWAADACYSKLLLVDFPSKSNIRCP